MLSTCKKAADFHNIYFMNMSKKRKIRLQKRKISTVLLYSRIVLIAVMLIIQLVYYIHFCLWISPNAEYFLTISIASSVLFTVYLVNTKQKTDFKMAWMLPVLLFPIATIPLYFLTRYNRGRRRIQIKIAETKAVTNRHTAYLEREMGDSTIREYPEIRDLAAYLRSEEHFPGFTQNRTDYYPSGEAAFPAMIEELKKAERFIFLDYFIIDIGSMWNRILNILAEKAAKGVQVRVLFDSIGSVSIASRRFRKTLSDLGIEVREFMPMIPVFNMSLNNRDHHKIMDIDGRVVFTGGVNLTDEYINLEHRRFAYWKDCVLRIEGSSAISFTKMFLQIWHTQERNVTGLEADCAEFLQVHYKKFPVQGAVFPYADDDYNSQELAQNVYAYILGKAERYVHIVSPYLILDETMTNALIFAAERGIDVRIVIPAAYDHYIVHCVGMRFAKTLLQHGVRIYLYQNGFIHSKIFVADDTMGTIGSVNLDYRSFYYHFECGAFLYQTRTLADIEADFEKIRSESAELTLETYRKRIPRFRRAVGWLCKIAAPML